MFDPETVPALPTTDNASNSAVASSHGANSTTIIERVAQHPDDFIPYLAIGGGFTFALIIVTVVTVAGIINRRGVERSRRELAAYVAEGTMSTDDAERLLNAGPKVD